MWCSVACHSDKWQNGCGAPSHITTTQWQVTELVWCSVAYHSNTVTSDSMGVALCGTSDVLVDLADIFHCLLLAYSLCLYVCIVLHSATHSMFILCVCTVQHIPCFHCLLLFGLLFLYSVTQGSPFHFVHCVCTVLYSAIVSAFFFMSTGWAQEDRRSWWLCALFGCVEGERQYLSVQSNRQVLCMSYCFTWFPLAVSASFYLCFPVVSLVYGVFAIVSLIVFRLAW